jgi:steroid delta-isomerase-like uncharacterized protein
MVKRIQILMGILFFASFIITGCESTRKMTLERNKELVRRVIEEVWSQGNHEIIDELHSADFVRHSLRDDSETKGLDILRDRLHNHRKAFPDWTEKIELIVAEGDFVMVHFTSTGTNKGSFQGNPATGTQIQANHTSIYRIVDAKIVEQWYLPDLLSLKQQLGHIPESK